MDEGSSAPRWSPPPPPQGSPPGRGSPPPSAPQALAPRRRHAGVWIAVGVVAVVLLLVLVASAVIATLDSLETSGSDSVSSGTVPRGEEGDAGDAAGGAEERSVPVGEIDVEDLVAGDCFDDPEGLEEISTVTTVPCDEAHDNEVYLVARYEDGRDALFPSDVEREDTIEEECFGAFEEFAGVSYELSALDIFTLEPSPESWEEGDRELLCAVYRVDGQPMVGSQRGRGELYEDESTRA